MLFIPFKFHNGKLLLNYEILCKNLPNKLSGSLALRKENPCVPYESQLRAQSKDHHDQ